jgi:hypothetical protein
MADTTYIPGVCNLGRTEIRARWIAAGIGLVVTFAALIVFAVVPVPWYLKVLVFLPANLGFVGLLQARFQFCVKYGIQGVFNVGSELGKTDTVEQAEFRKKDRQKAIQIIAGGTTLAAALTAFALMYL